MPFRTLFWNIENYAGGEERTAEVVEHVRATQPDIVGFSEIKDKVALRSILQDELNDFDFGITDGLQGIELLAGWKRGVFQQALFTQRREFKASNPHLRPGSLLSVRKNGVFYNLLFLHTDSGRKNSDYSNRQEMFEKIWSLKDKLDTITSDADGSRLLVLGDLNTMGRQRSGDLDRISGDQEIQYLRQDASANGMTLFDKSHPDTWARVSDTGRLELSSNLDHVLATNNVTMLDAVSGHRVSVRGWVDVADDQERLTFVEGISDHCSVECVVQD